MEGGVEKAERIREAARTTPDPLRSARNLERFLAAAPHVAERPLALRMTARLFSMSQFLANYCVAWPDELSLANMELKKPVTRALLGERAEEEYAFSGIDNVEKFMKLLRRFKKRYLLRITLRNLMGETGPMEAMDELSSLAETALQSALAFSIRATEKRHGTLEGREHIALIALGKLGGGEINYSSDVDLIAVYRDGSGESGGVVSPTGITVNRIRGHEFYSKAMETLTKVLSAPTEEGIAYRVDMRLRPQGQKGEIAMSLEGYRAYFENWGRTWERMTYIRARPVAGDEGLGLAFMEMIADFVWRSPVDYSEVEEIRALKKKIDSTFLKDDIKRGWGGIREAEFFVQTFQLIYGLEHRSLRTYRMLNAMQGLRRLGLVPERDVSALGEGYIFLRRLEHFLQMKDDLQTYTLPASEEELDVLGRAMGFGGREEFLSEVRIRRMSIRNMYNSLLGTEADVHAEASNILEGDLRDEEIQGYLAFRSVADTEAALRNLKKLRELTDAPRTRHERELMRRVIPGLLERALRAASPDRALAGLVSFFSVHGIREAYLTAFTEERELAAGMIHVFSLSDVLTRLFLSDSMYLNALVEDMPIRKPLSRMRGELHRATLAPGELDALLSGYKAVEWLRLGMFFLSGILSGRDLSRYLSHLAEALAGRAVEGADAGRQGFAVVALGKLGGREITFGSDLDLMFVSEKPEGQKAAERVLKTLTAYTDRGMLYEVDMRLRPDGTRGVLVKDLAGYRKYYVEKARGWEVQALVKARPVAGDCRLAAGFMDMVHEVIAKRGGELGRDDVRSMRETIMREHAPSPEAADVKVGPGGMEEIEFFVQWLQLQNAASRPRVLVQETLAAINRLAREGVLDTDDGVALQEAYGYYRKLKTLQRLNSEHALVAGAEFSALASVFMGHRGDDELFRRLSELREQVLAVTEKR
jgi:glutamate-ammonia-ligase adenylyltransferase